MRTTINIICILAGAGLSIYLALEHQASVKLEWENKALREQLSQMDKLVAENQRLSTLAAGANGAPSGPSRPTEESLAVDAPAKELVRLRAEMEVLRQQSKEIETLQAGTREARAAAQSRNVNPAANRYAATPGTGSQFELLKADYWTDKTNLDVAAELSERIRGSSLKAIAGNNLKGDPDFGQVKHLTVVYRYGGVTMTNEFREGDFVVLPKEPVQ